MLTFTRDELSAAMARVGLVPAPSDLLISFMPTYIIGAVIHGFTSNTLKDGDPATEMMREALLSLYEPPHLLEFLQ